MKYKLLGVSTEPYVNIGDYIQALASSQFLPHIDGFIQRETIDEYNGEESTIIMNGWYMIHPQHWPPTDRIIPLFYAFHINAMARKELLESKSLLYLKRNEPIGCRDTNTAELLNKNGIKAYFSGCMTLTLGYKYKSTVREDKCYIVDAFHTTPKYLFYRIKIILTLIMKWHTISIIEKKKRILPHKINRVRSLVSAASFFMDYNRYFTADTLVNAEYICQESENYKQQFPTDKQLLQEAERLVRLYAKAKLVITSRIHCALPCLGLETPVIYIENLEQGEVSSCRLGGLRDLLTIFTWNGNKLISPFKIRQRLSINNPPKNKDNWKPLSRNLIKVLSNKFVY